MRPLVIGSRGSQLALWQDEWVKARLKGLGIEARIEVITTTGDRVSGVALSKVGTKGLFTKELEEALLARTIDVAVHSLKDMPAELPAGLELAATPVREDARDAVIGKAVKDLRQGAKVGTGSLRRSAQLRAMRPDLSVEPIRGNLDTRLRKLDEGQYDAIVLAAAGLRRLGWDERIAELLGAERMCPAVGQGALAVEARAEAGEAWQACMAMEDAGVRAAITAERTMLAQLGGGCHTPIGGHAWQENGRLHLRGVVISPDGSRMIASVRDDIPECAGDLGEAVARELKERGAEALLGAG